ncbi:MAG TPA: hypothetical protein VL096_21255, partial [Pirellulaceae bacterium]|nr:hypothetical protein [Pirellulaceae bacterium]
TAARELAAAEAAAKAVEKDFQNLAAKMQREQFEIEYRRAERDRLSVLVAAGESTLGQKREELTDAQKAEYDLHAQLNLARRELRDLKLAKDAASNAPPTPGIIEHLPTPMAKTVFGKELHLRLQNGKIAFVPLNEFVEKLKADAQRNAWKLKDADRITEVLGPIDGFRMKYTLQRSEKAVHTQGGMARASYVELERFILIPMTDDLGEPLDLALSPGSGTRSLLKDYPADRTTVTVWVYPDSFQDFRKLKAEMFRLGYACAGRPLPEGHPIGGSPDGSHSAAQ